MFANSLWQWPWLTLVYKVAQFLYDRNVAVNPVDAVTHDAMLVYMVDALKHKPRYCCPLLLTKFGDLLPEHVLLWWQKKMW